MPERYEASLASFENTKDLCKITLVEVIHALQAQEQRRAMRQEGALSVKYQDREKMWKKKNKKNFSASVMLQQATIRTRS